MDEPTRILATILHTCIDTKLILQPHLVIVDSLSLVVAVAGALLVAVAPA
jgi:hypothetical protein